MRAVISVGCRTSRPSTRRSSASWRTPDAPPTSPPGPKVTWRPSSLSVESVNTKAAAVGSRADGGFVAGKSRCWALAWTIGPPTYSRAAMTREDEGTIRRTVAFFGARNVAPPLPSWRPAWCRVIATAGLLSDENRLLPGGLPVHVALAGVVPEHDGVIGERLDVLGEQRDLATAAGGVDHEVGHGEPGGPAAQRPDDLESLFDGRAEVLRAGDLVAHVDVIRPDPGGEQLLHQQLHDRGVVVHALQEDGLAAERDAGVGEHAEGLDRRRRELVRMVEVRVDVDGMVPPQDAAQLRGDALREMTRHAAPDADDLNVRDRPQAPAQLVDAAIGEEQRIAARHDHVADLRVRFQIAKRRLELPHRNLLGIAHLAAPRAEPAIRRAHRRHEEQRPNGIAAGAVRHRRMGVLGERTHQTVVNVERLQIAHALPPDPIAGGLDQVDHRRRDAELEVERGLPEPLEVRKVLRAELRHERVQRGDALLTQ